MSPMKSLHVLHDLHNEIFDKMVYTVSHRLFILRRLNGQQILPIRSTFKIYLKQILNLIFLVINYSYKKYWKKIKINLGIKVEHFLCLSRESSLSLKEVIVVWKWPLNHSALYTMIFLFFIWYSYPDKLHQTWSVGLRLAAKDVSALSEHPTFRRQGTYLFSCKCQHQKLYKWLSF